MLLLLFSMCLVFCMVFMLLVMLCCGGSGGVLMIGGVIFVSEVWVWLCCWEVSSL